MANIIQINGKKVKDVNAARMSSLAPVESSTTASMAHAVGDYFWLNGTLYEATAAITIGNAISVGTNCKITNMGENLADLKSQISDVALPSSFIKSDDLKPARAAWADLIINDNGSYSTQSGNSMRPFTVSGVEYVYVAAEPIVTGKPVGGFYDATVVSAAHLVQIITKSGFYKVPSGATNVTLSYTTSKGCTANIAVTAVQKIDGIEDVLDLLQDITFSVKPGYYNDSGNIVEPDLHNPVYSEKMNAEFFKKFKIHISYTESTITWVAYCTWAKDGTYINRTVLESGNHSYIDYISSEQVLSDDVGYIAFTYWSNNIDICAIETYAYYGNILYNVFVDEQESIKAINGNVERSVIALNPLRYRPVYDHLFITAPNYVITVPQQSLWHVRLSKRMGFDVIEANIATTSDDVYFTGHLGSGGTFGQWFEASDGITDISDIVVSTVTWDWITQNVRYKTSIAKYRTVPCTLQEFLSECRKENLTPFVYIENAEVLEIVESYMGVGNYIAYGASRQLVPNGIIYQWRSDASLDAIISRCDSYGKPFIYGMSNFNSFTDAELEEIVTALHERGYWIGTGYADAQWNRLRGLGFDILGGMQSINRIESGNLYNISSIYGFGKYTYTGAVETNGTLVFSVDGTVSPTIQSNTYDVCGIDVEVTFVGEIVLPFIGEHSYTETYTTDNVKTVYMAVPIINGTPSVTINAKAGTVIYDISYKASVF